MNSVYNLKLAGYAVEYVDLRAARPRERHTETAVVTLDTVKAAQIVGEDLTEVIRRRYESRAIMCSASRRPGAAPSRSTCPPFTRPPGSSPTGRGSHDAYAGHPGQMPGLLLLKMRRRSGGAPFRTALCTPIGSDTAQNQI